jgi:hypothetical protein
LQFASSASSSGSSNAPAAVLRRDASVSAYNAATAAARSSPQLL